MRHTGGVTASLLVQLPQLIEQGRADAAAMLAEAREAREARATRETSEARETRAASTDRSVEHNLIYRGDNLTALASLVATAEVEPATRAKLVYLDPPYDSGTDYRNRIETSIDGNTVAFTQLAYRDRWLDGTAGYLRMLIPRLVLARELLCDDGALIVHLDWHASHLVRIVLDELFGRENFVNQLVWAYRSGAASRTSSVPRKHDELLLYRRTPNFRIRTLRERQLLDKPFIGSKKDAAGNHYVDTILRDVLEGVINLVEGDRVCPVSVRPVLNVSAERTGYATQKPEGLLELLLRWCTDAGDLVVDAFAGSGTTAAVAARLGRRFVSIDSSPRAEVITRARLDAQGCRYRVWREVQDAPAEIVLQQRDGRLALGDYTPADGLDELLVGQDAGPLTELAALAGWAVTGADGSYVSSWRSSRQAPATTLEAADPMVVEVFDLAGRVTEHRFDASATIENSAEAGSQ